MCFVGEIFIVTAGKGEQDRQSPYKRVRYGDLCDSARMSFVTMDAGALVDVPSSWTMSEVMMARLRVRLAR